MSPWEGEECNQIALEYVNKSPLEIMPGCLICP
jgi:hypothetical protein